MKHGWGARPGSPDPRPSTLDPYVWLILALAFGLRTIGLSDLQVSGDAAWSVYLALKDLPDLTLATALDSHPPLYYYLLHAWMAAAGVSELSVRFLSACTGLLTVALTYKIGGRLLGRGGGLLAAVLAAISPFLVYFDRMPRMYSLLALLATLSLYLVLRMLAEGPGYLHLGLYLATLLAALYTHYYGVLVVSAGFLALAVGWRRRTRWGLVMVGGHGLVLVLFLPWLLYILGPSVAETTQSYGAIDLARPPHVLSLVERFWVALNVGDMWESEQSRALTWGMSALWGGGLLVAWARWKRGHKRATRGVLLLPASLVGLSLLVNSAVYQLTPYVPFTRLALLSTPAYLLLVAWVLGELWGASRLAAVLGTALALGIPAYALAGTLYVERHAADMEAVEVARRLGPGGGAEDGVIFQALWHAGYFRVRAGEKGPVPRALAEVSLADLPRLAERHPRLWLSMYSSAKRDPLYPHEEWLDRNAYKAQEIWQGRLRLSLYGGGADPPLKPEGSEFGGLVRLDSAGIAPQQVRPGEVLRLYLRWSALKEPGRKYVAFVHLVDKEGRGCTGRDGEPVDGLRPTESWRTGEVIDDRRGLMVGAETPPGPYYLAVGLYDREDWTRRLLLQDARGDKVLLGPLEVLPAPGSTPQDTSVASAPDLALELLGFDVDPRWEAQVIENVDGPVEVWTPAGTRAGASVSVTLRWRAGRPLGEAYRLRLEVVDGAGKAWGLAPEAPIGGQCPSFRWAPGEVVSETREVSIRPDAPRGQYRLRATVYPQEGDGPVAGPLVFGTLSVAGK